jgi:uncharacterized protein YuzE
MKFHYYPEMSSVDSREISQNIVIDLDAKQRPVGIDIQHASQFIDLSKLETVSLPIETLLVAR